MILKIRREHGLGPTLLDEESFSKNIHFLKTFFDTNHYKVAISFVEADWFDLKGNNYIYESKEYGDALLMMLNDLKNKSSCLYIILSSIFPKLNLADERIKAIKYILNKFISCIFMDNERMNDKNFSRYASYYLGMSYFKYNISNELINNIKINDSTRIDLSKLTTDQLFEYVIPFYYLDIVWPDREILRSSKEQMNKLSLCWFEKAKIGLLD